MKIAMLADRLVVGGLETHIVTVVNELMRSGHHILLSTAYISPEILGQIHWAAGLFKHSTWSENPLADVGQFHPDLIHSHPFTAIFRGYEVAKALHIPFFVTMHGLYDFGLDRSPLGNLVCTYVKRIIAVDHRVADLLTHSIAHPEKITVIYNGIDGNQFPPLAFERMRLANYGLSPDYPTLVVVSRLADGKEKPVFQLLECALPLARKLQGLNLLIVGGGRFFSEIEAKASALESCDLLRLKLVGEQPDVQKFLALAELVLACDRAAMEAMACQRAVFAMNAAGFGGLVHHTNFETLLLNRSGYGRVSNLDLIEMLARLLQAPAQLEESARNNRLIANRYFNSIATTRQLEQLYRKQLKR